MLRLHILSHVSFPRFNTISVKNKALLSIYLHFSNGTNLEKMYLFACIKSVLQSNLLRGYTRDVTCFWQDKTKKQNNKLGLIVASHKMCVKIC